MLFALLLFVDFISFLIFRKNKKNEEEQREKLQGYRQTDDEHFIVGKSRRWSRAERRFPTDGTGWAPKKKIKKKKKKKKNR